MASFVSATWISCAHVAVLVGLLLIGGDNLLGNDRPAAIERFVAANCYDCHQGESAEAGLDLQQLSFDLEDEESLQQWVHIYDRVHSGEMPPADWGEADPEQRKEFEAETHTALTEFMESQYRQEGRVRARRLTRKQVERSLQDILAIDIPLADYSFSRIEFLGEQQPLVHRERLDDSGRKLPGPVVHATVCDRLTCGT